LSLIQKWLTLKNEKKVIDLPGYGVVDCTRCHKYLRTGFVLSLMAHLSKEHNMHEDEAIRVGTHMLDLIREAKIKLRESRDEHNPISVTNS
jgi:hypothetical protein